MNICYLLPQVNIGKDGVIIGGSANSAINLAKEIIIKGNNKIIVVAGMAKSRAGLLKKREINGLKFIPIPINANLFSYQYGAEFIFKSLKLIKKLNKEYNFDIIHSHSGFGIYGSATALAGRIIKKPTIHTLYCPVKSSFKERMFAKIGLSFVNKIIVISQNIQQSLLDSGISKTKIEITPPFIDLEKYNPQVEARDIKNKLLGNRPDIKTVLFAGNLKPNKGLDLLIEAIARVGEKVPNVKVIITTERKNSQLKNPRNKAFFEKVEKKIKNHQLKKFIIFLETVENMPQLIAMSDLVIVPFRNTFGPSDYPLIALEAMACRKPVVAFNIGGLPEIVKDGYNGKLIPLENVEELADSISNLLLSDRELKRMGENGYNFVRSFLSPKNTYLKMKKIYETYQ